MRKLVIQPLPIISTAWLTCFSVALVFLLPLPAQANFTHEVVEGETLWGIAVKYDISLTELMNTNGLSEEGILPIGQELIIPSEYDFDYTNVLEHKVKAGEYLGTIAKKYGVSVEAICRFNGIEPDETIYIDRNPYRPSRRFTQSYPAIPPG